MGSKLSELDRYFPRAKGSTGDVGGSALAIGPKRKDREYFRDGQGALGIRYAGSYDDWNWTAEERDGFTGTITFYHHGSTSSDVNQLEYKDGKLVHKDWGFLPG